MRREKEAIRKEVREAYKNYAITKVCTQIMF